MIDKPIKISVAVITYNQQDTIRQTLDSILMQKGDFDLELVIGEDCSTDGTLAICEEYARQWNDGMSRADALNEPLSLNGGKRIVKLLSGSKNLGITANYFRTLQACTGEFIGDIAGDDFYCDDHALDKQMHYLQSHPEVGVLGANGYKYYVRRNQKVPGLNPAINAGEDIAKSFYFSSNYPGGVYLKPVGTMIRRSMLDYIDYNEILRRKLPVEDYPMQAIWSQYTHFACMPDLLVTYRVYDESTTFISFDHPKYLSYYRGLAETRRYLNELFPQDACITEAMIQEQLFYKEFLLYVHQGKYREAKQLIADAPKEIKIGAKVIQAKRFTQTWLHFIMAHYIKEHKYHKDILERT